MPDEVLQKYQSLFAKIKQVPVCEKFRAVHLIRRDTWIGTGTLIVHNNQIITCEHLFPRDEESDFLWYREIQPISRSLMPISMFCADETMDVGVCSPGESRIITHQSKFGSDGFTLENRRLFRFKERPTFTSLVTGEAIKGLGTIGSANSAITVLEYESLSCESGSSFIDEFGQLLVLTDGLFLSPKSREFFSVNEKFASVSLAIRLKVH